MNGKERILTALELREADCVPLYVHGINEAPIIGIGKHLTDGLPESRDFRLMNERDKFKLMDTLFMIHEHFDIDGITTFEINHEKKINDLHVKDRFGVVYKLSAHGIPVPVGHPVVHILEHFRVEKLAELCQCLRGSLSRLVQKAGQLFVCQGTSPDSNDASGTQNVTQASGVATNTETNCNRFKAANPTGFANQGRAVPPSGTFS